MAAGDGSTTVVVILDGDVELACGRLDARCPDLALVDALARLQRAARRAGCSVVVRHPSRQLCELLDLVGLTGVIAVSGLPLETEWQPEGGKEPGAQEVLPGGDLPA